MADSWRRVSIVECDEPLLDLARLGVQPILLRPRYYRMRIADAIPQCLAREGVVPGGTRRNLEHVSDWTLFDPDLEPWQRLLSADAQTSGGLLLCVAAGEVSDVVRSLDERATPAAAVVGVIRESGEHLISVRATSVSRGVWTG